ncbi:radical SAM protein [Desulfuromonas sp. TF]|uniref:radical SAM protein n=1 Tax=Desulfuromonas sp. TF TaxID=1232410 RepID=UPI0009DE9E9C|nr:radical SAM protein [Desulfuromonas sp. TF]
MFVYKILTLNMTWLCPVKCPYCHVERKASLKDDHYLDKADLVRACKEALSLSFNEFRFSGGEPTSAGDKLFDYARTVFDITGVKPSILTSGVYINENWIRKSSGLFSSIYISVENPLHPFHEVVDVNLILKYIKEYSSEETPLRFGLTLVGPESYKNLFEIFESLYEGCGQKCWPQLTSPYLRSFVKPTKKELKALSVETQKIFRKYGAIPCYFLAFTGDKVFEKEHAYRQVANLNPDGSYEKFYSLKQLINHKKEKLNKSIKKRSTFCQNCDWKDCCSPFSEDLELNMCASYCDVRRALFDGMLDGLENAATAN